MARWHLDAGGRIAAALVLAALGLGSWWWLSEQRAVTPAVERPRQPDSYFRELDAVRHDAGGRPEMRLTAAYAEHYENENWIHLRDFTARGLAASNPWQLSADRGRLTDDGVEMEAHGNVVLLREANNAAPLRLETERLAVNTETQLAVTDAMVTITRGASRMTGRGMRASLEEEHLRLEQDVEARYAK